MQTKTLAGLAVALALSVTSAVSMAQVTVGGAPMYSNKDIVDNAVNSKDHTTLVAAVKAAGLVDTLKSPGLSPYLRRPMLPLPRCRPALSTRCSSPRTRRN